MRDKATGTDGDVDPTRKSERAPPERSGTLDGIPDGAPALLAAQLIGEKAASVGFDWPEVAGVRDKIAEELDELDEALASRNLAAVAEELGDVLFTLTRLGSKVGVPPEDALRACIARFRARFEHMEAEASASGRSLAGMSVEEMDVLWRRAKVAVKPER
jgi:ATP diphosphatase